MQLEAQSQGTTGASGKKALYISFDRLSVNPQNNRMLILSEPSRYIPMSLEEMDSLPITFVFKNDTQAKLSFDSVSVKEDCLILKCSQNSTKEIDALEKNIKLLSHAFIEVNEPIGLITEWQNRVNNLPLNPKDSLRDTLRGDIEFIFGPPGTGKTTFISQRINDIIHAQDKSMKILVLAPTNKACDVLTRKLLELNTGNDSWIWRFEKTDDPFLEEEQLVYKRDCRISNQRKVCVISTMARYAFDGFEDGDLKDLEWDYVFIDEASMIPLYEVLPALYNSN